MEDKPMFEIRFNDTTKIIKIYYDGRVTGINGPFVVINRFPIYANQLKAETMLKPNLWELCGGD